MAAPERTLSAADLAKCEFNSDGVWDWVHPNGRSPPVGGRVLKKYEMHPPFMTANEYRRAEANRKAALERQDLSKSRDIEASKNE